MSINFRNLFEIVNKIPNKLKTSVSYVLKVKIASSLKYCSYSVKLWQGKALVDFGFQ